MGARDRFFLALGGAALCGVLSCAAQTYTIEHSPVTASLPGRPLTVRVRLKGDYKPVKTVTLLYAVSQDAAPFRIPMRPSGPGIYAATMPANLLSGAGKVSYYIEAADARGVARETPWYTVTLRAAPAPAPVVAPTPPRAVVPAPAPARMAPVRPARTTHAVRPAQTDEGWHWGWKETALLAGGGVLAGGVYLWLDDDDSGSSGGGGGGGGSSTTNFGTYAGTATLSTQVGDTGTTFVTRPMTLTIDDTGSVSSDTLHPGQTLAGSLNGSSFVLVAVVDEDGRTGEIQYIGTVVDDRIVGSTQGSATSAEGAVVYSGSFSANRQ